MSDATYSTQQAAGLCGVGRRSMLRWVKAGLLPSYLTGGGRHRIREPDLVQFMRQRGIPVPAELKPTDASSTVVLIDDDPLHLRTLKRVLKQRRPELSVATAGSGFAGGVMVAQLRPRLLVLDIVMDDMSGYEVLDALRQNPDLGGTEVVVLSGHLDPAAEERLNKAGVRACLTKPVEVPDLLSQIDSIVPRSEHVS